MPTEVIMPKVDMDMAVGTIAAWHVAEGEAVEKGAPLFDIETDKAAMEVESPGAGTLRYVSAAVGVEVPIGQVVAWIYAAGEETAPPPSERRSEAGVGASAPTAGTAPALAADQGRAGSEVDDRPAAAERPRATPAARRRAREIGARLDEIVGSGPRGRIGAGDVERQTAAVGAPDARRLEGPAFDPPAPSGWAPEPGPLAVLRAGRGEKPPLFLIHGFSGDAYAWVAIETHLPNDRELLKVELPSHGRSPRRRIARFSELARAVVEAFDALGLERAHVVGHSLGGAAAIALADVRPRRVASLSLLSPAGLGPEIDGACVSGLARATRPESLGPWLKRLVAQPEIISQDFVKAAMSARRDPALRAAQADLGDALFPDGVQAVDVVAALWRVEAPGCMIWGRSDVVVPWRHALRAPGDVALHLLEDVGHAPHLEAPARVGALIRRHIAAAEGVGAGRGAGA